MTWRTLTINTNGHLAAQPNDMSAQTGDGIAWFVVNNSAVQVKVKIKDFKRKSNGSSISGAVGFFTPVRATVNAGDSGFVVGRVDFQPSGPSGTKVMTKYTIELRSSLLDHDYDPDLEIERP
jgi:hypothetical protein